VHLASLGHPVVGDTLYGAPREIRTAQGKNAKPQGGATDTLTLPRNFLHAAMIEFKQPRKGEELSFSRPLPEELLQFLREIRSSD
jgi:23S rRNA pseudouridine1911/1915/1917 synthase